MSPSRDWPFSVLPSAVLSFLGPAAWNCHLTPRRRQPLPEKHGVLGQLDRYQRDFIRSRMALLHRFMNRVADHPVLSCNDSFKLFIVSKPSVGQHDGPRERRALSGPARRSADGTLLLVCGA